MPVLQMQPTNINVVAGKDSYLMVWAVNQDAAASASDVYAARVGFDGKLLDSMAIPVSSAAGDQTLPDVAFNGTDWLVVWNDKRNGGTTTDVYSARVNSVGKVLDPNGIAIATSFE